MYFRPRGRHCTWSGDQHKHLPTIMQLAFKGMGRRQCVSYGDKDTGGEGGKVTILNQQGGSN